METSPVYVTVTDAAEAAAVDSGDRRKAQKAPPREWCGAEPSVNGGEGTAATSDSREAAGINLTPGRGWHSALMPITPEPDTDSDAVPSAAMASRALAAGRQEGMM